MGAVATLPATAEHSLPAEEKLAPQRSTSPGRRRFTIAVAVGLLAVSVPYLWILWDLWNSGASGLRSVAPSLFYDQQARAMFHGHLYLPNGALGIEAFEHDGHQFTYFGLFPSLLRMPVLLLTSRFDGRLTAPSLLLSWMVTGVFSSLLVWRLRLLIRGRAMLGRAEAASYGLFVATIGGGSVLIYLAATPYVYNEDFAWSVALTVASLFALLGVLERPSWGRVAAAGVFVLAANLDRVPAGWGCVIGAGLIAGWFALSRGGKDNRRWTVPMVGVAVVPFAIGCAVTDAKFGIPIGLPMADQVWAQYNAHRRYFLAANGGKAFSVAFLPSTIVAYLQPFGIHFSGIFPFIGTPTAPAAAHGGAVLDETYPSASIPPTMPLLFALGCWGAVSAFLPRPAGRLALTRILLVAASAGAAGVLLWGYIADRYMSDFMPFLILAGAIGMIDLWRRLEHRSHRSRQYVLGGITALAAFSVFANVAIAIQPTAQFNEYQLAQYVKAQNSLSVLSLASTVHRVSTLPYWAPAGQLNIVGNCSGLYYSTGDTFVNVPGQQLMHWTWVPVEQQRGFSHTVHVTFNEPLRDVTGPVPILTYGQATLYLEQGVGDTFQLQVVNAGANSISFPPAIGGAIPVVVGRTYDLQVVTDPNMHFIDVYVNGLSKLNHYLAGRGPAKVVATPTTGNPPPVAVVDATVPEGHPLALCRSLLRGT